MTLQIPSRDGYLLNARVLTPSSKDLQKTIILCPAMGVKKEFYLKFAGFLAEQGLTVVLFDYRSLSIADPKKAHEADFLPDWGEKDVPGVIDWVLATYPSHQLYAVCHSIGGQMVGLADNVDKLSGIVNVNVQVGYWGHWAGWKKWGLGFGWYVAIPLLGRIFQQFPAKIMGFGENMPSRVYRQWARWGRDPHYLFGKSARPSIKNFEKFTGPVVAYSFHDDTSFAPLKAVQYLNSRYTKAKLTHHHLHPSEKGMKSIGHFGFFLEKCKKLWSELIQEGL